MINSIRLDSNLRTSRADDPIEVKLIFCLVFIIKLIWFKQILDRVAQETALGGDLLLEERCRFSFSILDTASQKQFHYDAILKPVEDYQIIF